MNYVRITAQDRSHQCKRLASGKLDEWRVQFLADAPCRSNASTAYAEQLGRNLQDEGSRGESIAW